MRGGGEFRQEDPGFATFSSFPSSSSTTAICRSAREEAAEELQRLLALVGRDFVASSVHRGERQRRHVSSSVTVLVISGGGSCFTVGAEPGNLETGELGAWNRKNMASKG